MRPDAVPTCAAAARPLQPERSQLPASPMELLHYLNSPEYQRSQEEQWARVRGSYEARVLRCAFVLRVIPAAMHARMPSCCAWP